MTFDHRHYVPCVRWKLGEYQAMLYLSDATRQFITPLIEVPEIGFDFESETNSKSIDKHLSPFAKRIKAKWQRPCYIDLRLIAPGERMVDGRHPVKFVFDELAARDCLAVPVTGLNRDAHYQCAIHEVVSRDKRGICVRISIEEAAKAGLKGAMDDLLNNHGVEAGECALILDLGAPNFVPLEGFLTLVEGIIRGLPQLPKWKTFTMIGTSFPASMDEIQTSPELIRRFEWIFYKMLTLNLAKAGIRLPTFGDYAINHPEVLSLDMRIVKPSATIRYTTDDAWLIVKGPNVRDYGFGQYRGHCRTIMATPHYRGAAFSEGDNYISDCASGVASTGNLPVWRRVGTNHHLEMVAKDVASFFAS